MSNYNRYKQSNLNPAVIRGSQSDSLRLPEQFTDYMKGADTRFDEVCELYLRCLTIDDLRYLKPDDLINLIPQNQHKHKLLMTIMVRKYLYRHDDCESGIADTIDDRDDRDDRGDRDDEMSDYNRTDTRNVTRNNRIRDDNSSESSVCRCVNKCANTCDKTGIYR
jgi:hypothetical protein